jgi:hypothetical protein
MLKQEVIKYFETIDLFNPIYMMAFSHPIQPEQVKCKGAPCHNALST